MTRLDTLASQHVRRTCHKALATALDRPDIAGMFDDAGKNCAADYLEWSARQALEDYARSTSAAKAAALAGEFITSALKGNVR